MTGVLAVVGMATFTVAILSMAIPVLGLGLCVLSIYFLVCDPAWVEMTRTFLGMEKR